MSRDQSSEAPRRDTAAAAVEAPMQSAGADTSSFLSTGPIPPVETSSGKATPSASELAYGKGVQALQAMIAKGKPKPEDVATLIDAHRDEHDQMLAVVQQQLGDAYATSVRADLQKLRASIANKEVVAGDPGDPKSGYFDASQQLGGAKWKTAGGGFTGTIDKNGLDSSAVLDPHDTLHANVKPDKSGTLDWNRDGTTEAELYGHYKSGSDSEIGLRRTQGLFGGSLTEGVHHQVSGKDTTDAAYADYKRGNLTAHADAGATDGKPEGHLTVNDKLAHDTLAGSFGHDAKGTNLDVKDTHDFGNGLTGNAEVKDAGGTWSETGSLERKTKTDDSSLSVAHDAKGLNLDAKNTHDWGNGFGSNAEVKDADGTWSETGSLTHKTKTDDASLSVAHDAKGTTVDAKDKHDWGNGLSTNGVFHTGPDGTTGSLGGTYKTKNDTFDASVTRTKDATQLHADATEQLNPNLSLTQKFDDNLPDAPTPQKGNQMTFDLGEKYKSGKVIEGMDLEGGHGTQNYVKGTGSVDAQLAPNLYGSAWGSYAYQEGKQNTAQLGGSLTFTPNEKEALTLAGVVDQHGRLETRLQFDVFKDKVNSIEGLDQNRKEALVSLFVSYSQNIGGARTLDDRFGAPDYNTNVGSEVTAGIKIRF